MAVDETLADRQRRYRERRAADDLVLIRAYVPRAQVTRARRLAKREGCPQSQIVARAYGLGLEQLEKPKAQAAASKPESSKNQRHRASKERRRQRHKKGSNEALDAPFAKRSSC
jgi:hypothetical protein